MFDRDYTRTHAAKASRAGLTLWWYMVSRGLNREPNLKPIRNLPSGDGLRNELARTKQIVACQENLGRIAIFTITILWINPCRTREVTIFLQIICILEINVLIFRSVGSGCLVVVPLELRPGSKTLAIQHDILVVLFQILASPFPPPLLFLPATRLDSLGILLLPGSAHRRWYANS